MYNNAMAKNVLVLAAGKSSRFFPFSERAHKSEFILGGKPLIEHMLDILLNYEGINVVVVTGENSRLSSLTKKYPDISIAVQKEANGMLGAIMSAKHLLKGEFVVILPYHLEIASRLNPIFKAKTPSVLVRKYITGDELTKGIVSIENGRITKFAEKARFPGGDYSAIGVYKLDEEFVERCSVSQGADEYAFEALLSQYADSGRLNAVIEEKVSPSLKYPHDLLALKEEVYSVLLKTSKKRKKKIKLGNNSFVEKTVLLSDGVKIGNNTTIRGRSFIGKNAFIGDGCLIRDSFLEADSEVGFSTEVARSIIGKSSHIHSGYLGDSILGMRVRIGANFITANKRIDRKSIRIMIKGEIIDSKLSGLGCIMGDDVHTGINVSTMPGTVLGQRCTVGANTEVRGTLDNDMLVYGKKENIIKPSKEVNE